MNPEEFFEDYVFLNLIEEEEDDYYDEDDGFLEEEKERKAAIKAARKLLKKLVRVLLEDPPESEENFYEVCSKILEPGMERVDFDVLDVELFKDELLIIAEQFGFDAADPDMMCEQS